MRGFGLVTGMGKLAGVNFTYLSTKGDKNSVFSAQGIEQRLRLLQVLRIKSFGEPAVDLGQHLVSFFLLALLLPQAREAHCRAEFQRFRLLLAGNLDGLQKTRFGFGLGLGGQGLGIGFWTCLDL